MDWKLPVKRNLIIPLTILCIVAALLVFGYWKGKSEVVATVNGENISKDELYDAMLKQSGQQALDSLISKKIIELEAKKQKITVSEKDIQDELEKYYEKYGGKEAFTQALAQNGFTIDEVKKDLELTVKVNKLLKPRIKISEEELKTYFEENKASFAQEKQVKASHILVETEKKANEIKDKLAKGEDFAKLAKENSTDPGSKGKGGDLGFFGRGQMVKEFEEAAFALKVGEISAPVKTEYGYHIIKVTEIKDAKEANYEQSKDKISDILFEQKLQTEYSAWLQELYPKYKIENSLTKNSAADQSSGKTN